MGIEVSTDVPKKVYKLLELYPQAGRNRPSVYYIPTPYKKEKS
ncbi:SDH family Clp fold serine proteinase [Methanocaldococcus sp.]